MIAVLLVHMQKLLGCGCLCLQFQCCSSYTNLNVQYTEWSLIAMAFSCV